VLKLPSKTVGSSSALPGKVNPTQTGQNTLEISYFVWQ
jgi:fumarate hydratase class II